MTYCKLNLRAIRIVLRILCFTAIYSVTYNIRGQILGDFLSSSTTYILGWNFIDDDANAYGRFKDKTKFIASPIPSHLAISKPIQGKIKVSFNLGYAKMTKDYYPTRYLSPGHFIFTDLNFRYQINLLNSKQSRFPRNYKKKMNLLDKMAFHCFPIMGFGYSYRTQTEFSKAATWNIGFGGTIWLVQNKFGLTWQGIGKIGVQKPFLHAGSNYITQSISLVYVQAGKSRYKRASRAKIIKSRTRI